MTKYLVENFGQVEQPVSPKGAADVVLGPGANLIGEFEASDLERMRNSQGMRVTRRDAGADVATPRAPAARPAARAKPAAKPAPKKT